MSRQKDNLEILGILYQYCTDNPDIRLGQALVNLDVLKTKFDKDKGVNEAINPYYEEPADTLMRVKLNLRKNGG